MTQVPPSLAQVLLARQGGQQGYPPEDGKKTGGSPGTDDPRQVQVVTPMGSLYESVLSEDQQPFERVFRAESDRSFYDPTRSPQNPFTFTVGSHKTEENLWLLVLGYHFSAAKVVGSTAGDTAILEPQRMGTRWSFDINVDGVRARDCKYEIDPVPIQFGPDFLTVPNTVGRFAPPSFFNRAASNSFGTVSGPGTASLPFWPKHFGPDGKPFSLWVRPNQTVNGTCQIFLPITVPLAYVEFGITGFKFPATYFDRMKKQVRPLRTGSGYGLDQESGMKTTVSKPGRSR